MVRPVRTLITVTLFSVVATALADDAVSLDDYDAFKNSLREGTHEREVRQELLHHHEIHTLIPEVFSPDSPKSTAEKTSTTTSKAEQRSVAPLPATPAENLEKTENVENAEEVTHKKERATSAKTEENTDTADKKDKKNTEKSEPLFSKSAAPHNAFTALQNQWSRYVDPTQEHEVVVKPRVTKPQSERRYGIRLGTQIPVKLIGGASSVQQGYIRFETTKTITGDHRELPQGTAIFGRPRANRGSDRIHIHIVQGITPEGDEFTLQGWIRGEDGIDGVLGKIVSDGKLVDRALLETVKSAGQAALNNVTTESVTFNALKSGAGQAQEEKVQEGDLIFGLPEFIVHARAQKATLEIEKTF